MGTIQMFKPYVNEKVSELVSKTLKSGWIGEGPRVVEFERILSQYTNSPFVSTVNSGTSALHLALLLAGVKPGDEVITTAQTMLATTSAILEAGAIPVYADVELGTGNLDAKDIERHITENTSAILAVDWTGYPCDFDALSQIAKKHNLQLIEDAAHSLGATYKDKPIGSICPLTCLSFQGVKLITTGDGGAVCINDEEVYERATRLRWFGISRTKRVPSVLGEHIFDVTELGYKYHMNDIAASIGICNMADIDMLLERRHTIVAKYRMALQDVAGVTLFDRDTTRQSADWMFSIHVEKREEFCRMMVAKGIMVSVVHLRIDSNTICGGLRDNLPMLSKFTQTHVSLPLHNLLNDEDVDTVIRTIKSGW